MEMIEKYSELSNKFDHNILTEPQGRAFVIVNKEVINQPIEYKENENMVHFWKETKSYEQEKDAEYEMIEYLVDKYSQILEQFNGKKVTIYWRSFPVIEKNQDFSMDKPQYKCRARGTAVAMEDEKDGID